MSIRLAVLAVAIVWSTGAPADIDAYLKDEPKSICESGKTNFVEIDFTQDKIGFAVKPQEAAQMNRNLAERLGRCRKQSLTMVPRNRVAELKKCDTPVLVAKIDSYVPDVQVTGDKIGVMTMTLLVFPNARADAPDKRATATGKGEPWWGDNKPLERALDDVADKLCALKSW